MKLKSFSIQSEPEILPIAEGQEPIANAPFNSERHSPWVKWSHWIIAISFFALAFSGYVILMCHPRLYWGQAGNDLTPALIELPISRNYKHNGWTNEVAFSAAADSPRTASRTYDIFNQNSWGRSLHFLAAWVLLGAGFLYLLYGVASGHIRRNLLSGAGAAESATVREDLLEHLRLKVRSPTGGPQYGRLQRLTYAIVVLVLLPLTGATGLAMSPAITASVPFLSSVFRGHQSARTIHFFLFVALMIFVFVHIVMVIRSGFRKQMRAMTWGQKG